MKYKTNMRPKGGDEKKRQIGKRDLLLVRWTHEKKKHEMQVTGRWSSTIEKKVEACASDRDYAGQQLEAVEDAGKVH